MTFCGHKVLKTLIKCQFSPSASTGERYIITGSADSFVAIYDLMTGETINRIGMESWDDEILFEDYRDICVRDVSWHPSQPVLAAASFKGEI